MPKRNFTATERYAVFTAHRERCWLCNKAVSLRDVEIDHIIPESLEESPKLVAVLHAFALPSTFQLNSYENWMAAHPTCNRVKSAAVFDPTPLIQLAIQEARKTAPKAREIAEREIRDGEIARAHSILLMAEEKGKLSEMQRRQLQNIFAYHEQNRLEEDRGKELFLAPGLKVLSDDGHRLILRGPGGMVGGRPKGDKIDYSWDCPNCGVTGWNGTRCIICGMMIDPD